MPAGAEAPWRCIVATGIPKEISYTRSFLFIFLEDAEEMLMAIINLPYDHPNIFIFDTCMKCPKSDMGVDHHLYAITLYG